MKLKVLSLILLLAACRDQQSPPAPTSEQADQLNEAEAMLNSEAERAAADQPATN